MGNYEQLKSAIAAVIKTNGNNEITGALLQQVLIGMTSQIGANMTFKGVATPATQPATPDQNCFYMATEKGVYSNFDGQELDGTKLAIFFNSSGTWRSWLMPIVDFTFDNTPTEDSTNPVTSDGIFKALMQHDDIIFFADVNGTKYEVEYVWNPRVQDWDELMSDTPLDINAGKIYIDHISFDMFTSPYVGAWIQLNALQASTYSGTVMTEQTAIAPTGTISKTASGVTKTYDLPAESGTLARKEETLPNKTYAPLEFSGLGRKYLQKNIVSDKNVLTQAMVSEANTEFVVQYDYDLNDPNGENPITIPANSVLNFAGGSIKNGKIIGNYTTLEGVLDLDGVVLAGTFKNNSFTLYDIGCIPNDPNAASSNATKINSFASILSVIKKDLIVPKGEWHFNAPIVMDGAFSLLCDGYLVYDCTSSNVINTALTIGTTNTYSSKKQKIKIYQSVTGYTFPSSPVPENVGVKFINAYLATIEVDYVHNFAYSVIFVGDSLGCAYNNITIDSIGWGNCKTALTLTADNGGWINENIITGVSVHNDSTNVYKTSMIGIVLSGDNAHRANNNVFIKPCVEGCAIGIKLNFAEQNSFNDVRTELVTKIVESGDSCRANLIKTYGSDNLFIQPSTCIENSDLANVLAHQVFKAPTSYVRWLKGGEWYFSGISLNAATIYYTEIGNSIKAYGTNYYLGHVVDTSVVKDYLVKTKSLTRFVVRCFDSNGDVITNGAFAYSYSFYLQSDNITFITGGDAAEAVIGFTDDVKSAFIGVYPSAKEVEVSAYRHNNQSLPSIISNQSGIINIASPTYTIDAAVGDRIYNQITQTFNYWDGENWVDYDGLIAGKKRRGFTSQRPTLQASDFGLEYFDLDLGKDIHAGTKAKLFSKSLTYKGGSGDKYFYALSAGSFYAKKTTNGGNISAWLATTDDIGTATLLKLGEFNQSAPLFVDITATTLQTYSYILFKNEYGSGNSFDYYQLDMSKWVEEDGAVAGVLRSGATANRPASTDIYVGFEYFDTDLGLKVVWNGSDWIVLPKYEVVNALPASPDSNTLYLIEES